MIVIKTLDLKLDSKDHYRLNPKNIYETFNFNFKINYINIESSKEIIIYHLNLDEENQLIFSEEKDSLFSKIRQLIVEFYNQLKT